ncbi:20075_t:CDS:2 [Funneliformis geosporum]|nr:20075_t:CDS:2 [Funneliformis geosporum]
MNSKETFPQPYFIAHQCLKRTIIYFFVLLVVVGYICYDDQEITKPDNGTAISHDNHTEITIDFDEDGNIITGIHTNNQTNVDDYNNENILLMSDEGINQRYCGNDKCKFLFVYNHPDDETLANEHMRSFTQLAKALNRTMVLTNVGHSKISSCRNFPFNFYYSIESLLHVFPHVSFISQKNFKQWTRLRHEKPTTQHIFVAGGGVNSTINIVNPKSLESIQKTNCLDQFEMKFDEDTIFKKIRTGKGFWKLDETRSKFSKFLVDHLNEIDEEIILLNHDIRKPFFPGSLPKIDYSQLILQEADRIVNDLQPFIAIYWRSENQIPPSSKLPECAQSLVETLKRIKTSLGIENVYFTTDYPISSRANNLSLNEDYHKTIEILNSTIKLNTWKTMNPFKNLLENNIVLKNTKEFNGRGIHRILEKLIIINSDYFLSSPPGCGASYKDDFILSVTNARSGLMNEGNERLLNIITRW